MLYSLVKKGQNPMQNHCYCCSEKPFSECCEPYLSGLAIPPHPETLMRARYTAFARNNTSFIEQTMHGKALNQYQKETKDTQQNPTWISLTIMASEQPSKNKGFVTFMATYLLEGNTFNMHEKSTFQRINGRWFYTDGEMNPQ